MVLRHVSRSSPSQRRPSERDRRQQESLLAATGVPALPADEVAASLPLDAVPAAVEVGVRHGRRAVGPPREEVAVMGALFVGSDALPAHEVHRGRGGRGRDAGDGDEGREEGRVGEHRRGRLLYLTRGVVVCIYGSWTEEWLRGRGGEEDYGVGNQRSLYLCIYGSNLRLGFGCWTGPWRATHRSG